MNITEYRVRLCDSCFWITGYVEETFNGTVPVHCCCDRHGSGSEANVSAQ